MRVGKMLPAKRDPSWKTKTSLGPSNQTKAFVDPSLTIKASLNEQFAASVVAAACCQEKQQPFLGCRTKRAGKTRRCSVRHHDAFSLRSTCLCQSQALPACG